MNNDLEKTHSNKSDIIRASEIGQYQYCSISWKLQKNGYRPNSLYLNKGRKNDFYTKSYNKFTAI